MSQVILPTMHLLVYFSTHCVALVLIFIFSNIVFRASSEVMHTRRLAAHGAVKMDPSPTGER